MNPWQCNISGHCLLHLQPPGRKWHRHLSHVSLANPFQSILQEGQFLPMFANKNCVICMMNKIPTSWRMVELGEVRDVDHGCQFKVFAGSWKRNAGADYSWSQLWGWKQISWKCKPTRAKTTKTISKNTCSFLYFYKDFFVTGLNALKC